MGFLGTAYLRALQTVGRRLDYGENVFDREWDVLVVLDACRSDLLASVAPDIEFLGEVKTVRSVGSCSSEWLEKTFPERPETTRTAMVTGNTWTDRYVDAGEFAALDEVWKYAWDDDPGTVPARAVTDRAIALARERNPEFLVIHYMQPHHPFVPDPIEGDEGMVRSGEESSPANPWISLRRGKVRKGRVWEAYEANLRYVLEEVEVLLSNIEGRVVITADHGNLFGEWGLYGHPMYTPVPAVLDVPWAVTTGTDRSTRSPVLTPPEPLPVSRVHDEATNRDRLAALGYVR